MLENHYAFGTTLALALIWVRLNDYIAYKQYLPVKVTRKIIHVGTGPLFMMCWVLFELNSPYSALIASLVPFLITAQFALVGLGIIEDKQAVQAISRSGDPRELLYGPLQYGLCHTLLTIIYWSNSIHGIIGLCMLCGGDGVAALVGEWIPSRVLITHHRSKKNTTKTIAGSSACFIASFLCSFFVFFYFSFFPSLSLSLSFSLCPSLIMTLLVCSFATTVTELYAPPDYDNLLIVVVSLIVSHLCTFLIPLGSSSSFLSF